MTQWLERAPREPVVIDHAFADPERIRALVPQNAPYWPTLRYVANEAELAATGGDGQRPTVVMPWFRGDWAYDEPTVEGADEILATPSFAEAARAVFDAEIVRPQIVYVNLMVGIPFAGPAHIDVPAFRGLDRTRYPVWLLHTMNRSGLFEAWRIPIATAVSWFFGGEGGAFEYWAHGPKAPPERIAAPLDNRAVVGDNDVMFHRVGPVGAGREALPEGDGIRAELVHDGADASRPWAIVDDGRVLRRHADGEIRISISWKAEVFVDAEAARIRDDHSDDLDLERVVDRFLDDLAGRGVACARPADPLADERFTALLAEQYPLPAVCEAAG